MERALERDARSSENGMMCDECELLLYEASRAQLVGLTRGQDTQLGYQLMYADGIW